MSKVPHYDPDNLSSMDTQWDGKPERKVMSKAKTLEDRAQKFRDITLEVLAISGSDTIDEVRIMAAFARQVARQVAREERERCAKVCDKMLEQEGNNSEVHKRRCHAVDAAAIRSLEDEP